MNESKQSESGKQLHEPQKLQEPKNSLAKVSLILSIIAVAICLGGIVFNLWIESNKVPDKPFQSSDLTVITDKLENAASFGIQFLVIVISHAASLALSLTAVVIGAIALSKSNSNPAKAGVAIGVLGIVLVFF